MPPDISLAVVSYIDDAAVLGEELSDRVIPCYAAMLA